MNDLSALLNGEVYGHSDHGSKRKVKKKTTTKDTKSKKIKLMEPFLYMMLFETGGLLAVSVLK